VSDLLSALESMRANVLSRIGMLQDGVTYYDERKRQYYLQEYRDKLIELDRLLLSLSLKAAGGGQEDKR